MRIKRIAVLAIAIVFAFGAMSAYAAGYKLTVYSGNGMFGSDDYLTGTKAEVDAGNGTVTVDGGDPVEITMPDGKKSGSSKYFVLGLKQTGYDNDEYIAGPVDLTSESSPVKDEDASLVVAYGLKSNMTKYTVRFIEAATGGELAGAETHYGVQGGKPIISYKYIEGYLPNAWNETGRIAADGSTVFTFYYYEVDNEGNVVIVNDGNGGNAAGGNAAGGGNAGNAGNAANGTAIADNQTPLADGPQNLVDIDDNAAPKAGADNEDSGINKWMILLGALILAALAAGTAVFVKRRNNEDEVEE